MTTTVKVTHQGPDGRRVEVMQADSQGIPAPVPPILLHKSGEEVSLHIWRDNTLVIREKDPV